MKNTIFLYFFLALFTNMTFTNSSSQRGIVATLQDYCSSFYLNWICRGDLEDDDFYYAAQVGRTKFLEMAKDYYQRRDRFDRFKAQLNKENKATHKSPLQVAMQKNHLMTAKFLLDHDAEINERKTDLISESIKNKQFFKAGLLLHYKPVLTTNVLKSILSLDHHEKTGFLQYLAKSKNPSLKPCIEEVIKSEQTYRNNMACAMAQADKDLADIVVQSALQKQDESVILSLPNFEILKKTELKEEDIAWLVSKLFTILSRWQLLFNRDKATLALKAIAERFPEKEIGKEELQAAFNAKNKQAVSLFLAINPNLQQTVQEMVLPCYKAMYALMPAYQELQSRLARVRSNEIRIEKRAKEPAISKTLQAFCEQMKRPIIEGSNGEQELQAYVQSRSLDEHVDSADILHCMQATIAKQSQLAEPRIGCCICMEAYKEDQPFVTVCANEHHVCVKCFNEPSLESCPLCRNAFSFNKEMQCQGCLQTSGTKFVYCIDCDITSVSCNSCVHFACCRKPIPILDKAWEAINTIKVREIAQQYQNHIDEKSANANVQAITDVARKINEIDQAAAQKLEQIKKDVLAISKKACELKAELDRRRNDNMGDRFYEVIALVSYNQLVGEYNECVRQLEQKGVLCNKIKENIENDIQRVRSEAQAKILQINIQAGVRSGQLQMMAPAEERVALFFHLLSR